MVKQADMCDVFCFCSYNSFFFSVSYFIAYNWIASLVCMVFLRLPFGLFGHSSLSLKYSLLAVRAYKALCTNLYLSWIMHARLRDFESVQKPIFYSVSCKCNEEGKKMRVCKKNKRQIEKCLYSVRFGTHNARLRKVCWISLRNNLEFFKWILLRWALVLPWWWLFIFAAFFAASFHTPHTRITCRMYLRMCIYVSTDQTNIFEGKKDAKCKMLMEYQIVKELQQKKGLDENDFHRIEPFVSIRFDFFIFRFFRV